MLRYADGWSLLSLISDVGATRKGSEHEINSHTSVEPRSGSTDAYGAGILADAVTLLMDESQVRQPWDPYLGYSG